jgi:hypothetical protein
MSVLYNGVGLKVMFFFFTVMMRTHRKVAQAITRIPPPKSIIKPIFFSGLRLAFQSIGNGIDSRYTSVMILNARYTQTTWAETAG